MAGPSKNKALELADVSVGKPGSTITVTEKDIPEPGEGQVLVNIKIRPINPADVLSLQGLYPGFTPKSFPAVAGLDGMAVVVKNGPGASKFAPGDRVVATPWNTKDGEGSWQQYVVISESALHPVPDALSDEAACQFFVNPFTVYGFIQTLEAENLIKTGWIVSQAAGSAVGRMLITYAKSKGLKTINLVRRAELEPELLALGADVVLNTTQDNIGARIREITGGEGADAAFECVGGDVTSVVESIRNGGAMFMYGAMANISFTANLTDMLFRDVSIRGFWLGPWFFGKLPAERRPQAVKEVFQGMIDGTLGLPAGGNHFALEQFQDALDEESKPGRGGKVFLEG